MPEMVAPCTLRKRPRTKRHWLTAGISPYKPAQSDNVMSALANRPFVKMNGLGNEIVVVDMRRQPSAIEAAAARRGAAPHRGAPR
jgi:hypothetical protein